MGRKASALRGLKLCGISSGAAVRIRRIRCASDPPSPNVQLHSLATGVMRSVNWTGSPAAGSTGFHSNQADDRQGEAAPGDSLTVISSTWLTGRATTRRFMSRCTPRRPHTSTTAWLRQPRPPRLHRTTSRQAGGAGVRSVKATARRHWKAGSRSKSARQLSSGSTPPQLRGLPG